ncbi:MAG: guanylate kinase [Anaerolineae bacterium]|jgi:guanylate kinase
MSDSDALYHLDRPPLLIVISGTSGAGKDSVARALVRRMQDAGYPAHFVVTATSRPRRETEVDGIDYIFVSKAEFERMIAQDRLLEYAIVYNQYKGIPRQQATDAMTSGKDVVMRLDVQGAATIRRMAPDAVSVFVTASSEQELAERLRRRHTESEEQLCLRLQTARHEMRQAREFDYIVPNVNGKLEQTVDIVMSIVIAEKHRANPRRAQL